MQHRNPYIKSILLLVVLLISGTMAIAGLPDDTKCEVSKHKTAARYLLCMNKAEIALAAGGSVLDYNEARGTCEEKILDRWAKVEAAADGACPTKDDSYSAKLLLQGCIVGAAAGAAGSGLPLDPLSCELSLDQCSSDLSGCRYTNNGDGTVTDNRTGLMWQLLDDGGGVNDWDYHGTWAEALTRIELLNATSWAGHSDWRLPNQKELFSIVDLFWPHSSTAIDSTFKTACSPGCVLPTCSCTKHDNYWTSTSDAATPSRAWLVYFGYGGTWTVAKSETFGMHVRAVRDAN